MESSSKNLTKIINPQNNSRPIAQQSPSSPSDQTKSTNPTETTEQADPWKDNLKLSEATMISLSSNQTEQSIISLTNLSAMTAKGSL